MENNEIMNVTEVVDVIDEVMPKANSKLFTFENICKGGIIGLAVYGTVEFGKKVYRAIKKAKANAKAEVVECEETPTENDDENVG